MSIMNSTIRKAVEIELKRRDMTQEILGDKLGRSRQQINNALRGKGYKTPELWQEIFDVFGWRLVVVDEHGNEVK